MIDALIRIAAPVVWRNDEEVARKLEAFAAAEAGSALDMLKAAELETLPRLRRLYFRHAMDEARHARRFAVVARQIRPLGAAKRSEFLPIHARRHDLLATLGRARFLAFVHLAESRGEGHFRALAEHFADRPELSSLFRELADEERFHVRYSIQQLLRLEGGRARGHLRAVRAKAAWDAWRRQGRLIGSAMSRALMALLYLLVLPPFVLLARWLDPAKPGWKSPSDISLSRRQF